MSLGPGKYDQDLKQLMEQHSCPAGLLMLIGGKRGHGVSCKVAVRPGHEAEDCVDMHKVFISVLRRAADQMEAELPVIAAEVENENR